MKEKAQSSFPNPETTWEKCPQPCRAAWERGDSGIQLTAETFDTAHHPQEAKQTQLSSSTSGQTSSTIPVPMAVTR